MTFIDILYTIFIGPLQLIFEIIYAIANRFIGHPGLAIIILSLIMNFLVLPLYKRSDEMQEAARDVEEKLREGVTHIKKVFSGDEQMMILQTYYRQNDYKPTDALNGSVSLLLEIPFFMAAYNFLSNLDLIQGVSLGPITNLGAPDAMFVVGGFTINVLPILMTLINVISSAIYLKGFPLKTKIQLYGMAGFFLVFLYTSPSGLVFYWTLNNLFSLVKTLFYKMKNPKKVLAILASLAGAAVLFINAFIYEAPYPKRELFMIALGLGLQVPLLFMLVAKKLPAAKAKPVLKNDTKLFVLGVLFLAVLVGLLIPTALVGTSPQEFVDPTYYYNPLWYIARSACLAVGTFLVWFGVFYWIASPAGKWMFDRIVWILCGVMLVNYMFFGTDLGTITANLQFEKGFGFEGREQILNLLVLAAVAAVMYIVISKWQSAVRSILLTAVIAMIGMSAMNIMTINTEVSKVKEKIEVGMSDAPQFNLSKEGKNVVVIMLDRAMGQYVPYIMNEKPELKEQFAGFTYYANTISHGGLTYYGAPGVYGGYEYVPSEMNKRDEIALVDKHNESLTMMPVLFAENGYEVTVTDPPHANYEWTPDLSIYDEYPEIDAFVTDGVFGSVEEKEAIIQNNMRNFFCYSIMKSMPLAIQNTLYEHGNYNCTSSSKTVQVVHGIAKAEGLFSLFLEGYRVLENMSNMTTIVEDNTNTFLMLTNNTTHEPTMLQLPEYEPVEFVDNTAYYDEWTPFYSLDGSQIRLGVYSQVAHYHVNMASFIQLGKWFDYLRENDVYDNTKIILVADHGQATWQFGEMYLGDTTQWYNNGELFYPLLMVKDFNSTEFSISDEFMTNADVPTLAVTDVIPNAKNPFTGKLITNADKTAHEQYIVASGVNWELSENEDRNVFLPTTWWAVKDNIWDKENWRYIDEECTDPEGK